MVKPRTKNIVIAVLSVLVVLLFFSNAYYFSDAFQLRQALSTLLESIIEKSDCKTLKAFHDNSDTMQLYGSLVNQTEKDKGCR